MPDYSVTVHWGTKNASTYHIKDAADEFEAVFFTCCQLEKPTPPLMDFKGEYPIVLYNGRKGRYSVNGIPFVVVAK